MRRLSICVLALLVLLSSSVYAIDSTLLDIRTKIFDESKIIKSLLGNSQDVVLLNSMWGSCIMTMTQLDAYFSMLGLFNTIKKENLSKAAIKYLTDWLREIKTTNEVNIKALGSMTQVFEKDTKMHIDKLNAYLGELNSQINTELGRISVLERVAK